MTAVTDPELMGNLFLAHGNMGQGISFIEEIIIATVDVLADLFLPVFYQFFRIYSIYQLNGTVAFVPALHLLLASQLPTSPFHPALQFLQAKGSTIGAERTG